MQESLAVILERPQHITVKRIPIPPMPGSSSVRVEMRACGICGSDVRYYQGENPWSLHTLGKNLPSPPNMVLGHEVAGVLQTPTGERRVAILAYKACGMCEYCRSGRENLCDTMEHFGHSAGWPDMPYYPGGMSEQFDIWDGFAYEIPEMISFEEATFLDGLAVAVHAVEQSTLQAGQRFGVLGLGPIGMLAAQVARAKGASYITGCDVSALPVELAAKVGLHDMVQTDSAGLKAQLCKNDHAGLDAVIDTVGTAESITNGLSLLNKSGILVLLAVHEHPITLPPVVLSGERKLVTSSNNKYKDFPAAIALMAFGHVVVRPLITHRFPLNDAIEAFRVMQEKEHYQAYKIILSP
jgi:threonine dehydrogenase-like Zn-dependent dehydrogenase